MSESSLDFFVLVWIDDRAHRFEVHDYLNTRISTVSMKRASRSHSPNERSICDSRDGRTSWVLRNSRSSLGAWPIGNLRRSRRTSARRENRQPAADATAVHHRASASSRMIPPTRRNSA
jgi:hypothetical protein